MKILNCKVNMQVLRGKTLKMLQKPEKSIDAAYNMAKERRRRILQRILIKFLAKSSLTHTTVSVKPPQNKVADSPREYEHCSSSHKKQHH
jgi:hypothetical protein